MVNIYYLQNDWKGIFQFLKKTHKKEDIVDHGVVSFSVSSNISNGEDHNVKFPLGINNANHDYFWISGNFDKQTYEVIFNMNHVILESYTYKASSNDFFPTWYVYGSNDRSTWTLLDKEYTKEYPNPPVSTTLHVDCSEKVTKPFTHFKFQVEGTSNWHNQNFPIFGLEFFGKISMFDNFCTRVKKTTSRWMLISILLFKS